MSKERETPASEPSSDQNKNNPRLGPSTSAVSAKKKPQPGKHIQISQPTHVIAIGNHAQHASLTNKNKPWVMRKRTYIAQALILFNVWGIPLSFGPYLEYYYNRSQNPLLSLAEISSIIAAQLLCIFIAPFPTAWLYQRGWWRGGLWVATIASPVCQFAPALFSHKLWPFVVGQGISLGCCLGMLGTVGTLCLATHYKNNIPVVSMIGTSAGLLGAAVYTTVAYDCIRNLKYQKAAIINATITGSTLFIAAMLIKQYPAYAQLKARRLKQEGNFFSNSRPDTAFFMGYVLVFFGLFAWPTYMVLLIASAPGHAWPTEPTMQLIITYIVGFFSAILVSSRLWRRRLGPVNTISCASILAGASCLDPAWMPWTIVSWPNTVIYGTCLGAIVSLHVKAIMAMSGRWKEGSSGAPALVARSLMGVGITAAAGILVMALVLVKVDRGVEWAMMLPCGAMILGGYFMVVGRMWKSEWVFYVAI